MTLPNVQQRLVLLLRLEAVTCLAFGLGAIAAPEGLVRLLLQAPVGSTIAGLDAVTAARLTSLLVLGLAVLHLVASRLHWHPQQMTWAASVARVAFGLARWLVLFRLPWVLPVIGWVDLALAVWTVVERLRLGVPTPPAPHDPTVARQQRVVCAAVLGVAVALLGAAVLLAPQLAQVPHYASDEEHFKHGSLDAPLVPGLPFYVFEALPGAFPDRLPGGWESLGFLFEAGHDSPIGFARRTVLGVPMASANCALCHSTAYRATPDAPRTIVPTAPAGALDFHGFLNFLLAAGADARFTDGTLLREIRRRHELGWWEDALYGRVLLPALATGLQLAPREFTWMSQEPAAGPGRMDAGSFLKFNLLRLPHDGTLATSDFRPLWNQRAGYATAHRWSGGGQRLEQENMLAAALFHLLLPPLLDEAAYARATNFMVRAEPPRFPGAVDAPLAARGGELFRKACAICHEAGGAEFNRIAPLARLGVDRAYMDASTPAFLDRLRHTRRGPFVFDRQQASDGYLNGSLQGTWLCGPYLHNGSVPTLWDLLQPPQHRPVTFARGGDVLDPVKVGFVPGPGPRTSFQFDTRLRGNQNTGHTFGVDLPEADKQAIVEFLKTL